MEVLLGEGLISAVANENKTCLRQVAPSPLGVPIGPCTLSPSARISDSRLYYSDGNNTATNIDKFIIFEAKDDIYISLNRCYSVFIKML